MDCLNNLIGIHRKCSPDPVSKLYLQDLPGLTLSVANASTDNETISGIRLIEEKIEFAQSAIVNMIRNQIADKMRIGSIIQNDILGYYQKDLKVVPSVADELGGIYVSITQYPYLEFFISSISLKLEDSVNTNIYIYDLMSDTLLDTFNIDTVAKTPTTVLINKGYQTKKQRLELFICTDSGISNTYKTNLTPSNSCNTCSGGEGYSNRYLNITAKKIDSSAQKISGNLQARNDTNGISLDYSLNCSIEPFICNMGNLIAWPLLHKVASELLLETIYSRRQNSIVNVDSTNNEALQLKYDTEYMASMQGILNNIKMPNDICFQCNSRIKKTVAIP